MKTNLILSPHKPSSKASFDFNWNSIEEPGERSTAQVLIKSLAKAYENSIKEVSLVATRYTSCVSKTVWSLKQQVSHGTFRDVCRDALSLNDDQIASYAQIGRYLEEGALFGKALAMVEQMEPRAAVRFIKSSEETKNRYVATFEDTGKVPSQRAFQAKPEPVEQVQVTTPQDYETLTPNLDTIEFDLSSQLDQFLILLGQIRWDEVSINEDLVTKLRPWGGTLEGIIDMTQKRKQESRYV